MTSERLEPSAIIRADHPFDAGYWARYDAKPKGHLRGERLRGWKACDAELRAEASGEDVDFVVAGDRQEPL